MMGAVNRRRRAKRMRQIDPPVQQDCINVDLVLGLCSLLDDGSLGTRNTQQ